MVKTVQVLTQKEYPMTPWPAKIERWLRVLQAACIRFTSGTRVRLRGTGHQVNLSGAHLYNCRIELKGGGHLLEIGSGSKLWGVHIQFAGENLSCRIGSNARIQGGHLTVTDTGSRIEIGSDAFMFEPMIVAQEGCSIVIGPDCMMAYGVDVRCSDGHSILDVATGSRLNPARDVLIGEHVWIGFRSSILKGARIESNAVVAAGTVVTKTVSAGSVVAGDSARQIRSGITWDRRRLPE